MKTPKRDVAYGRRVVPNGNGTTLNITPFEADIASFRRHLRAANLATRTTAIYTGAAEKFATWLVGSTDCADWQDVEPRDIEDFTISILKERSAGYANNLHRSIQAFFKWWSAEYEQPNPMLGLKPPVVPEKPVPVLTEKQLKALLKSCEGTDFVARRDTAILRVLMDCGVRRGELAAMKLDDLDLDDNIVYVMGKGRRPRAIPFGSKAALALDRYLRARGKHKLAHQDWLWLGTQGSHLTASGLYQLIERLGERVGITELHPHMLRHSFAHYFRANGGQPDDLKRLAGWKSDQMLARYGASLADERARAAARRHALGDRL